MRWRFIFAISLVIAYLLFKWLPIESQLFRFLLSGLCFSLVSRIMVVISTYAHRRFLVHEATIGVRLEEQASNVIAEKQQAVRVAKTSGQQEIRQ